MGFSSLHVCMESSSDHWLQGTIEEESSGGMDSSPSPISISSSSAVGAGDMNMIACSTIRPMMMTERKLRPPQDQLALKCPRCDSTHTKFCYYNNYSLSQPRYFCKACRRYWTKGGTLRNIPVGGGCRKNRKVSSSKKSNNNNNNNNNDINNNNNTAAAVGPSYPSNFLDVQFPHHHHIINNLLIGSSTNAGALMESNPDFMVESKYNNMGMMIRSSSRNLDLFGVGDNVMMSGYNNNSNSNNNNINVLQSPNNYLGFCSSSAAAFGGLSLIDGNNMMESCHQRLMFPYGSSSCDNDEQFNNNSLIDVKPNPRVLSLEWQDNMMQGGCSDGKETFGCIDGPGSWNNGVINGFGSSATNPLV